MTSWREMLWWSVGWVPQVRPLLANLGITVLLAFYVLCSFVSRHLGSTPLPG